jgi:beta-glucosidase
LQDGKIRRIIEANPNTAVVLISVGPVTGDFIDKTPALLFAVYAGESQGSAIASVLLGEVTPAAAAAKLV